MQGVILAIAKARQTFDRDGSEAGLVKVPHRLLNPVAGASVLRVQELHHSDITSLREQFFLPVSSLPVLCFCLCSYCDGAAVGSQRAPPSRTNRQFVFSFHYSLFCLLLLLLLAVLFIWVMKSRLPLCVLQNLLPRSSVGSTENKAALRKSRFGPVHTRLQ